MTEPLAQPWRGGPRALPFAASTAAAISASPSQTRAEHRQHRRKIHWSNIHRSFQHIFRTGANGHHVEIEIGCAFPIGKVDIPDISSANDCGHTIRHGFIVIRVKPEEIKDVRQQLWLAHRERLKIRISTFSGIEISQHVVEAGMPLSSSSMRTRTPRSAAARNSSAASRSYPSARYSRTSIVFLLRPAGSERRASRPSAKGTTPLRPSLAAISGGTFCRGLSLACGYARRRLGRQIRQGCVQRSTNTTIASNEDFFQQKFRKPHGVPWQSSFVMCCMVLAQRQPMRGLGPKCRVFRLMVGDKATLRQKTFPRDADSAWPKARLYQGCCAKVS